MANQSSSASGSKSSPPISVDVGPDNGDCRWEPELVMEYEFRVFVLNHRITAVSQYDHYTYYPDLHQQREFLLSGITELWERIHHVLCWSKDENFPYVVDIAYLKPSNRFVLVELSPFSPCTGGALFSWQHDMDILQGRQPLIEFRLKQKEHIHPQLHELVEINWEYRWRESVMPYTEVFEEKREKISYFSRLFGNIFWRGGTQGNESQHSLLFVYGTLKRGFQWNEKYLASRFGCKLLSEAETVDAFALFVGKCGVPYVLHNHSIEEDLKRRINGELWSVPVTQLRGLDEYEGVHKEYYRRETIRVRSIEGKCEENAFIYLLNEERTDLKGLEPIAEYTKLIHDTQYHPLRHIQLKQIHYYKTPSTWGKTSRPLDALDVLAQS